MKKKLLSKWVHNSIIVSCQQISAYIKEEFGVRFSVSGTYKLLLSLGYGFKQLSLFPSKPNVEKQNEWVNQYKMLESSLDDDEVILFMDGVLPTAQYEQFQGVVQERAEKVHPLEQRQAKNQSERSI